MKNNTIHIIGDSHAECFDHIDFGNTFKVNHLGGVLAYNLTKQVPEIIKYNAFASSPFSHTTIPS